MKKKMFNWNAIRRNRKEWKFIQNNNNNRIFVKTKMIELVYELMIRLVSFQSILFIFILINYKIIFN